MADLAQIIASIDGYRNYETNRALELQNQGQLLQNQSRDIQNQEMMTINDLKRQIANLSSNPYAKLNAWSPETRGKQLLNEDKQLKIASKWASSIKNLAPEKRAQGYAQFLRAMESLGADITDMPQAYDEAYVNQVADLGIDTETRYQNEQQNARMERQIAANREARQDEFDKRLAAFNYENNYKTKVEKQKLDEKDAFVRSLGYDDDTTNSLLAANRGITTPGTDDIMLKRLNNNPQDAAARAYFQNKAEAAKFIKENEPVKPLTAKEQSEIGKNLGWTADPDVFNSEGKFEFKPKPQANSNDIEEKIRAYRKLNEELPDMPEQDKQRIAFGDTYTGEAYGAGLKAGAEAAATQPYLIARDNNASRNRITENVIGQYVGDKIKRGQMVLENDIKKDFEAWKNKLPQGEILQAQQYAQELNADGFRKPDGSKYTASDILYNPYKKAILDNLKTTADIAQTQAQTAQIEANTEKTQKETETVGMSNLEKNIQALQNPQTQEWLKNNPWAEPYLGNKGTTVNIDKKSESKYAEERAKENSKNLTEYRKAANDAASTIYSIDNMIKAIKNEDVYQGTAGQMVNSYKRLLSSMGKDVKGMSDAAILDSGKSLLLGKIRRDVMSGTTSDRDISFLIDMVPSLGKTKEQNLAIAEMYKKTYQRQVDAGRFVNDYIKHNGRWDDEGELMLQEFLNKPLFTEAEKARASGIPESEIKNATPTSESYDFSNVADEDLF